MLHDDSISCIVSNRRGTLLVTGAIDASIKLWKLGSGSGVLLSPLPIVELFEHDQAIACLSLNPESDNSDGARKISGTEDTCYLAAGAEDGVLILWDIGATVPGSVNVTASAEQPLMLFSCQVSQTKNPISGIVWVPLSESKCGAEHPGYPIPKLVCSTVDGSLMCLDVTGKLIVGTRMEVGIYCIAIDTRMASGQDGGRESSYIYAGCSDGSLRAWAIENNSFVEKFRGDHAHTCTVNGKGDIIDIPASACHSLAHTYSVITSMAVCKEGSYLITGADDGSLRTWRIE